MPTLVLLAGPNGPGKTTFLNPFLRERAQAFQFVNPGEAARRVPDDPTRDLAAGRLVPERLEALMAARLDVIPETTLARRSHSVRIRDWQAAGHRVELVYIRLPSVEHSIAHVAPGRRGRSRHPPKSACAAAFRSPRIP